MSGRRKKPSTHCLLDDATSHDKLQQEKEFVDLVSISKGGAFQVKYLTDSSSCSFSVRLLMAG
jgi:hypothetical protein